LGGEAITALELVELGGSGMVEERGCAMAVYRLPGYDLERMSPGANIVVDAISGCMGQVS